MSGFPMRLLVANDNEPVVPRARAARTRQEGPVKAGGVREPSGEPPAA